MNINSNILDCEKIKYVHFVGIGGSSMSGLAEILLAKGYKVSGSDIKSSNSTQKLEAKGAEIFIGHRSENITDQDLTVYTVAVKEDNPEITRSKELGLPVIDRAELLGLLMKKHSFGIAVAGTHGKTTTTSMITTIMLESNTDPTAHIGGELDCIGGNTRIGNSEFFITEACEYYGSFLKFHPFMAVVLNIELDHVDYFRDLEHIKSIFGEFLALVPNDGYIVACADDENTLSVVSKKECNIITYGLKNKDAMWTAKGITYNSMGCASFDVYKKGEKVGNVSLSVPGPHNVNNSLAAIAVAYTCGCSMENIAYGLSRFGGSHKRFELKGLVDNIKVIDDYAHHPSEVQATLNAAKSSNHNKIWCVFQPHTYTRTKAFLDRFSKSFGEADNIIITDIYAAREKDPGDIHSSMLADRIRENGGNAVYISDFQDIAEYLDKKVEPGDLILTMGAGDIVRIGEMFLNLRANK
ncbi:UDP-N-acetylmuramate--L-alanine ligase [Ruminiclostridium cellulolyticum]|uniref:UDP-N-acetylmuramate--L-alanine ligase n=1 Tax=Ruminiclostridium cellulolyticum (strain ATCC 35319 / DSM 5812 / JCM 6584 / H10) TaxID=394503 RepID=B8I062_RUMCH|nr:UDP-N-acetylmuramate--L-alanine ligase [Ruminiclostridium cellulolyticum]ACL77388.1 UDP-N-acetylmuramate/alanine ligase [Ruminiclostridium cellulolyticum H10]